jgi:hypothetical protein
MKKVARRAGRRRGRVPEKNELALSHTRNPDIVGHRWTFLYELWLTGTEYDFWRAWIARLEAAAVLADTRRGFAAD